ncbi:hypothetical protein IJI28_01040 [Candidatus Saccharibacteria bacterium]|nr:hypothetical protein [Candidatus Saccharibacteria bacterium]
MLDTVFNILKVTVIVAIAAVFMVAITGLLNLITSLVFSSVVGEILALISMYLPFNALNVFGAIGTATVAILSFLIAKKIFDLTSWSVSAV